MQVYTPVYTNTFALKLYQLNKMKSSFSHVFSPKTLATLAKKLALRDREQRVFL